MKDKKYVSKDTRGAAPRGHDVTGVKEGRKAREEGPGGAGHATPVLCDAVTCHDGTGKTADIFATAPGLSESRRVEAERGRLATVVEQLDETVVIIDTNWKIQYVNAAFEKKTGYSREEIVGEEITVLGSKIPGNMFYRRIRDTLEQGQVWIGRRTGRKKDGSTYRAEVSMSPIREESGISGYVAVARDITEQLKLEEQLRQARHLEAIGTLAGGIAHDFNNILAGILGFAEMALDDLPRDSTAVKNLRYVMKGALRGRELVKQILAFSRRGRYARRPLSVSPVIKETTKLLRASLPSTVRMDLRLDCASDVALADPSEIQQILVNLATNGAEAMGEDGGALEISLTGLEVREDRLPDPDIKPGIYLQLAVKDTGAGMDPETARRVFEPFFTTKETRRATGLGLAAVFGIVKGLHGAITVESTPGAGSTFRVLLPGGAEETKPEKPMEPGTLRGVERILFVDDEDILVEWAKAALERLGYRVTATTGSAAAYELFATDPAGFDLVITDQTMPEMTGRRLAGKLLHVRPDIPILLCTGHSDDVTPESVRKEGIRELLMKPLSNRELAQAIRRTLDG